MPSSFHSTAHRTSRPSRPPALASASERVGALAASIGRTGRPTSSPNAPSAALPPDSAAAATAPSEPRSIMARRTSATGTDSGPCHRLGHHPFQRSLAQLAGEQADQEPLLVPVARPNSSPTSALRAAAEPFPDTAPIAEKRRVHLAQRERRRRPPA